MTTPSSQPVKCLNTSPGRRRFVFKSFSRRVEEINIDVFRSLEPMTSEPKCSSFFLESLLYWRELNTAEDFISFYDQMMPLVQTLPQILLHKERIFSELLRRVNMKTKLSLEPILMLLAALSRDILQDFLSFLQRLTDALVDLLANGGDRDPDILEQVFRSWSYIMMYLQKYLVKDVVHILKITTRLRFFPKDYVQEFMAEAVSFLVRNSPMVQLREGIRKIILEVGKSSSRKVGATALLWHVVRGTSSRLHSRAEKVLRLLINKNIFSLSTKYPQGPEAVLEVITGVIERLCEETDHRELSMVYKCLFEEISSCIEDVCLVHLDHLLALLTSTVRHSSGSKVFGSVPLLELLSLLVQTYIVPVENMISDHFPVVLNRILRLMLCLLDVPLISDDLSSISQQYAPAFKLRNSSLLLFIKGLLLKGPHVVHAFRSHIISAMDHLIESLPEEVLFVMFTFFEREEKHQTLYCLDGVSDDKVLNICKFFKETLCYWSEMLSNIETGCGSLVPQVTESKLAVLWGVLGCYPHFQHVHDNLSLISNLIGSLDRLLGTKSGSIASLPKSTWQSLLGATLMTYHKLLFARKTGLAETSKFLDLAKRHKSSSQVLFAVAEFLDSVFGSKIQADATQSVSHDLDADEALVAVSTFADNLGLSNKAVRISTLRILSHYAPIGGLFPTTEERPHKKLKTEESVSCNQHSQGTNVIDLLHAVETTPLSISTSRKIAISISKMQMGLSSSSIHQSYITLVLNGIIGVLHNRFSHVWEPALACLSVLLARYKEVVWSKFVQYQENYQLIFLSPGDRALKLNDESPQQNTLSDCFNFFRAPHCDSTPCVTVTTLLLQTLQKIPDIVESKSRQLIPLFLRFLGYADVDLLSVEAFSCYTCTRKEWRSVLKEWLNLLRLMRNAPSLYQSQFLKEVLASRLLDEVDPDIQLKVLDCLLNWKDEFLMPYHQHLRNLIVSKNLREELTTWSVSRDSQYIQEGHRGSLIPLIIQLLTPKVKKLKTLASRKHVGVHHRRAILCFLAQLDVDELHPFFSLLLKNLHLRPLGSGVLVNQFDRPSEESANEAWSSILVKCPASVPAANLSWKKINGFLHVVEDILRTFDELHIKPFLTSLMSIVAQILENCMLNLTGENSSEQSVFGDNCTSDLQVHDSDPLPPTSPMMGMAIKQYKDLRSLCLKIISFALSKYDDHDFGCFFWDSFFISVKPLIDSFKQAGSSSEKPSSLFSCFIAMSRSPLLVSLLDREANLVPTIFSILTVRTASDAIISSVLNFIENLLSLDNDINFEEINRVLLPHIGTLIESFCGLFDTRKELYRKSSIWSGRKELKIFKLLVKYTKDPLAAEQFVDMLLPYFRNKSLNSDECLGGLQIVKEILPILSDKITGKILSAVYPLLVSAGLDLRLCICDIIDGLALIDPSFNFLAGLLRKLNAVSSSEVGELDYDIRISAYETIGPDVFSSLREEHALAVLCHCIYDMSSEELVFRQSAFRSLQSFIHFAASVLNRNIEDCHIDTTWTGASIQRIIKKTFLQNIGEAMRKDISIQKEWIALLREMVYNMHKVPALISFRTLCSEDPEVDFFNNILHLQIHRRGRALSRFRNAISAGSFAENTTVKIFVPLFFNMLLDVKDGKGEHLRNAFLETLASISGHMQWESYRTFLMRCFREMTLKPDKQKIMIRLICAVLDKFHFFTVGSSPLVSDDGCEHQNIGKVEGISSNVLPTSNLEFSILPERQVYLEKAVFQKIKKLLTSDSEKVNVNISLAAIKLLKLLPEETMDAHLPSILHHVCNFLKHRLESIRDEARSALAACAKELGIEKLQLIVKILKGTLKRGFELHVLGYSLNFILSKMLVFPVVGKLDSNLEVLLSIAESDILGDVAEEKEVDKIASKMKETRKSKSFDTLKLISQSITFRSHALKLLSPIVTHLQKHLTPKTKAKLEQMLYHIALGIECNPSTEAAELFIFVYGLIEDAITSEYAHGQEKSESQDNESSMQEVSDRRNTLNLRGLKNSHLIVVFSLGALHNRLKNMKLDKKDEQLLSMLDPFVGLLGECMNSKYEDVVTAAFRCLAPLIKLPLPSLEGHAENIKIVLLDIARKSGNASSPLMQSCLKLLMVLLRSTRISLTHDQLRMLIQFPMFIDILTNPSPVALSLLKSIVGRKLVVHEIYDIVLRVAELMVTGQSEPIRKKCSQILLQFLLDYHISDKRLQQHMDFLLTNLSYEHSTGREAVLEMLHAIIIKLNKSIIDNQAQTFFLHLVVALANERDRKVQSLVSTVLKELIERVSPHALDPILEYSLSWYMGEKQHLWSAAAQVLGLLVEVLKKGFQRHISSVLQVAKAIMESSINAVNMEEFNLSDEPVVPFWKEAYYSLDMFKQMLKHFPQLYFEGTLEDIWGIILKLLLHPHLRLRNICSHLVAQHLNATSGACKANHERLSPSYLVNPSRLFVIAVSSLNQLKAKLSGDDETCKLIIRNLVSPISLLHSFAKQTSHSPLQQFWSSLDHHERDCYLEAFKLLGSAKAKDIFVLSTSDANQSTEKKDQSDQGSNISLQSLLVAPLLKRMGKITMELEDVQMKIVFNCFKMLAEEIGSEGCQDYAFHLLLPLYKVCEGFAGKVVGDEIKQLAEEVRDSIRGVLKADNFVQVYNQIRKRLKERRDKRKNQQKQLAVINPVRHAKRKLQIAAKHQAHKKRKITSMKMSQWRR